MQRIKILQVSWSLSSGGAERFVVDLSNRLAENSQLEIVLVTLNDDTISGNNHYRNNISDKVRYVNIGCRSGVSLVSHWRFLKFIMKEKPQIVHGHCGIQWLYLPSLLLKKVKFVHTLHNLASVCLLNKRLQPIDKWFYTHRIQPVTISKTCLKSYEDLFQLHNAECITNGREPMKPSGVKPKDVSFLSDKKLPVFIHVARCHPQKNQKRLFAVFDQLQNEGISFQLMVIGSGFEETWMPLYKDNSQIHILGERKNVADYMALSDFFVLTSDFEGLPLTLLEAMSLGVIPICTPAGGIVDVIHDGVNGFICHGFDNNEFLNKVKEALNKVDTINREKIMKDYRYNYSMEVCVNKYYKLYQKL